MKHYGEDELILYYYGEGRKRARIEKHLDECAACQAVYREISGTLAIVGEPDLPERGDQYGLEVWQRIRHKLPAPGGRGPWSELDQPWWMTWFRGERLMVASAVAMLVLAAFVAGRYLPRQPIAPAPATGTAPVPAGVSAATEQRQRILLTSVADHLDRSERVLTDIMNTTDHTDISTEQRWAEDLLTTSRLYRQDAVDIGEQSVASVLDDLERSLLEIVHSPSRISAADLEQIRRRIDAAALLFKVRVLGDQLRQRESAPAESANPRSPTQKTS